MNKYKIQFPKDIGNGAPEFQAEFDRVNIILGGNGTGKSKVLNKLKEHVNSFGMNRQLIYVEGGRTINIPHSLQLTRSDFDTYRTFEQTERQYKSKLNSSISQRIKDALILLEQKEQEINNVFAKDARNWDVEGRQTPFPIKPQAPLERLFEVFNEVFPSISLQFNTAQKNLICLKDGNQYSPAQLSDGEKQIFCLLADIFILAEPQSLILIDEPELNLNPGLACRFWDTLENELPDSIFIYATHCVSFAMRNHVNYIIVLSKQPNHTTAIEDIGDIDSSDLRELLGAIPSILSSSKALAVEGKENSFDQSFYRWLLNDNDLEVIPVGGCSEVFSVATKTGVWEKIAPSVKIAGVIDSDYRNENELVKLRNGVTHVLDYHEVESYLCNPKLIHEIASKLSVLDTIPTVEQIENIILEEFENKINYIVAQRTFARGKVRLGVSVSKRVLKEINTTEDLKEKVKEEAIKESNKAIDTIGEEKILEILNEELIRCQKAINDKNIAEIMTLIPGKELLNRLAPIAGCRSERNLVNAAKKHIHIQDYSELQDLKIKIESLNN